METKKIQIINIMWKRDYLLGKCMFYSNARNFPSVSWLIIMSQFHLLAHSLLTFNLSVGGSLGIPHRTSSLPPLSLTITDTPLSNHLDNQEVQMFFPSLARSLQRQVLHLITLLLLLAWLTDAQSQKYSNTTYDLRASHLPPSLCLSALHAVLSPFSHY